MSEDDLQLNKAIRRAIINAAYKSPSPLASLVKELWQFCPAESKAYILTQCEALECDASGGVRAINAALADGVKDAKELRQLRRLCLSARAIAVAIREVVKAKDEEKR